MHPERGTGGSIPAATLGQRRGTATRPRILAYAYDVEPDQGSEPGAGWSLVRILAGFADVTVITRRLPPDADGTFASWTARITEPGTVRFVSVRLPGDPLHDAGNELPARWSRQPHIAYLLWQIRARRTARRLNAETSFDLTWHLTWANGWFGSSLAGLGPPFVLGPVGGGVHPPWRLVVDLGRRAMFFELIRVVAGSVARHLNPLAINAWRKAHLILVQNRETLEWLPEHARPRARVFHNATVVELPALTRQRPAGDPPMALFAARLVPWKGGRLALRTIAALPGWKLIVCGDGPEAGALRTLARELGIEERVDFRGQQPRDEILRLMGSEVDVLLLPSLHDEAGLAVAEAAAIGLPIVCLDRGGPPVIAGGGVTPGTVRETIERLRVAMEATLDSRPRPAALDPATRREELLALLGEAGVIRRSGGAVRLTGDAPGRVQQAAPTMPETDPPRSTDAPAGQSLRNEADIA